MFEESFRGLATSSSRHELPRARRHDRQPRGPAAAPAPRRDRAVPGRARLDREARRALRGRGSRRTPRRLRRDLRALLRRHHLRRGRRAGRAAAAARSRAGTPNPPAKPKPAARACGSSPTGRSSPAPPSSARPSCEFQRPTGEVELSRERRDAHAGSATARPVTVSSNGTSRSSCARASRATCRRAPCGSPQADAGGLHATVEVTGVVRTRPGGSR